MYLIPLLTCTCTCTCITVIFYCIVNHFSIKLLGVSRYHLVSSMATCLLSTLSQVAILFPFPLGRVFREI